MRYWDTQWSSDLSKEVKTFKQIFGDPGAVSRGGPSYPDKNCREKRFSRTGENKRTRSWKNLSRVNLCLDNFVHLHQLPLGLQGWEVHRLPEIPVRPPNSIHGKVR